MQFNEPCRLQGKMKAMVLILTHSLNSTTMTYHFLEETIYFKSLKISFEAHETLINYLTNIKITLR